MLLAEHEQAEDKWCWQATLLQHRNAPQQNVEREWLERDLEQWRQNNKDRAQPGLRRRELQSPASSLER